MWHAVPFRKIKSKQQKVNFVTVVVSLMAKEVVELGELMHMAQAVEPQRCLAIKLLISSIWDNNTTSYAEL